MNIFRRSPSPVPDVAASLEELMGDQGVSADRLITSEMLGLTRLIGVRFVPAQQRQAAKISYDAIKESFATKFGRSVVEAFEREINVATLTVGGMRQFYARHQLNVKDYEAIRQTSQSIFENGGTVTKLADAERVKMQFDSQQETGPEETAMTIAGPHRSLTEMGYAIPEMGGATNGIIPAACMVSLGAKERTVLREKFNFPSQEGLLGRFDQLLPDTQKTESNIKQELVSLEAQTTEARVKVEILTDALTAAEQAVNTARSRVDRVYQQPRSDENALERKDALGDLEETNRVLAEINDQLMGAQQELEHAVVALEEARHNADETLPNLANKVEMLRSTSRPASKLLYEVVRQNDWSRFSLLINGAKVKFGTDPVENIKQLRSAITTLRSGEVPTDEELYQMVLLINNEGRTSGFTDGTKKGLGLGMQGSGKDCWHDEQVEIKLTPDGKGLDFQYTSATAYLRQLRSRDSQGRLITYDLGSVPDLGGGEREIDRKFDRNIPQFYTNIKYNLYYSFPATPAEPDRVREPDFKVNRSVQYYGPVELSPLAADQNLRGERDDGSTDRESMDSDLY